MSLMSKIVLIVRCLLRSVCRGQSENDWLRSVTAVMIADTIAIMCPGEAKIEFKKRLEAKKLKCRLSPLETKDKMTDPQIAAHVRQLASVDAAS